MNQTICIAKYIFFSNYYFCFVSRFILRFVCASCLSSHLFRPAEIKARKKLSGRSTIACLVCLIDSHGIIAILLIPTTLCHLSFIEMFCKNKKFRKRFGLPTDWFAERSSQEDNGSVQQFPGCGGLQPSSRTVQQQHHRIEPSSVAHEK